MGTQERVAGEKLSPLNVDLSPLELGTWGQSWGAFKDRTHATYTHMIKRGLKHTGTHATYTASLCLKYLVKLRWKK